MRRSTDGLSRLSRFYLQELQEPELQLEHPEEVCFPAPLMPKVENFFTTLSEVHSGHDTPVFPKTSFSNSRPHAAHLYSKMGIFSPVLS